MKNKFKSKIIRLLSFALVFNLGFGVAILSSNCAKKNDLSYILDPETGKKYFFDNLTKTNICGIDGNIIIGDHQWERKKFNLPIFLSNKIKKIDDNFLANCVEFDQQIVVSNSCLEIGNNFLFNCHDFNSNLHLAKTIKNIGNSFMYMCVNFNKALRFDYLTDLNQIGNNFLFNCIEFNNEINIKSKRLKNIGDFFLFGCKKFNSKFYLNSPVLEVIGDSFFERCTSFDKPIDLSGLIKLKSLGKSCFAHCENFNSNLVLPSSNLIKIDDRYMFGNYEYNCPITFPNSIQWMGKFCCADLLKYNHILKIPESIITKEEIIDKNLSDEYGIGEFFFHNCWSMTSTIDFGLHDITKILKPNGSLSCGIHENDQDWSSEFTKTLHENLITLYFLKKFISDKNMTNNLNDFFNKFSFQDIGTNSDDDKKIETILETLSFFEQYSSDIDSIKQYFTDINEFKNLLKHSKKLELILKYFHGNSEIFGNIFLEYYKDSEFFEDILKDYKDIYQPDPNNENNDENNEIKPQNLLESVLSNHLYNEVNNFCNRHNYFYKGIELKSLNKTSQYSVLSDIEKGDSWKYSNDDIYCIKFDVCKGEAVNFARVLGTFNECKEVKYLLDFISNKFIDDKILTNNEHKKFFISKVKSLNQLEIKLLCFALNNYDKFGIFYATSGLKSDENRRKIKNNLNKILESEQELKSIFKTFLKEQKNNNDIIDFSWLELFDLLDNIGEYGAKYDANSKDLDLNNNLRKSLKMIGEHFDENERLLILDWLNKKESNSPESFKKYQLLIRVALSNLIDKNALIDQMFDELFDFNFDNNNVIKKINGENVNLNEFEENVLTKIQSEFLFKTVYDWSIDHFVSGDYRDKIAMSSYIDFFIEKLWNEEFLPNWFNEIISKNDNLDQIFTPNKVKKAMKDFWENELNDWQLKQKDIKKKCDDRHNWFAKDLCEFLTRSLKRSELVLIAKKVLKEKIENDLINEINKISTQIMKEEIFNNETSDAFIHDLKTFFTNNKKIFVDCLFLEKNNTDFVKKLNDPIYVQGLLSKISYFKFGENKKNILPLYYYLINSNYHQDIVKKLHVLGGEVTSIFYKRILATKKDFYEKLGNFSFYNDTYEPKEKNFFLKQMYKDFLMQLFENIEGSKNKWFFSLFRLGEDDKVLINFINNLAKEKKDKWDEELKKNPYLYQDFKNQIIFFFKKTFADIINDKKNKLSYFKSFANNISIEDSYTIKILNEIIKIYDQKILITKNDDNFQKYLLDKLVNKHLFDWLKQDAIDYGKWDSSVSSEYEINKKIKNYKYTELNCFLKYIDKCQEKLDFLSSNDHQNFFLHLNQEMFKQLQELYWKWKKNKQKIISSYLAKLWDKSCSSWDVFVTKFDDNNWKNQNKQTLEELADILDCSYFELNQNKINTLSKEVKNNVQDLVKNPQKESIVEQLLQIHKKWKENKQKIIPFYLAKLWDKSCSSWDVFVTKFDDNNWKNQNKQTLEELADILDCSYFELNQNKINTLSKEVKNNVQDLVKNHQDLFSQLNQENYLSIEEINEYCKKINDFFSFVSETLFQIDSNNLQFSDKENKKEIIELFEKMDNCVKKTKIKRYEDKVMHTLFQEVINSLADHDKMNSSTDLLDIINKVYKLNKLFLENKNISTSDKNGIINFFTTITNALDILKKENEQHKNKFLSNTFFTDFYLIYGFGTSYKKANISIKAMSKDNLEKLHDKMNDLLETAIDMTPIKQFISEQTKVIGSGIKQNIHNLYEKD